MTKAFMPDYAVHPGVTLQESLENYGLSRVQLAKRTALSRKTINAIINGREPITHEIALRLEKVFRVPARFWVNMQANFDEATVPQDGVMKNLTDEEFVDHHRFETVDRMTSDDEMEICRHSKEILLAFIANPPNSKVSIDALVRMSTECALNIRKYVREATKR